MSKYIVLLSTLLIASGGIGQKPHYADYLNETLELRFSVSNFRQPNERYSLEIVRVSKRDGLRVQATDADIRRMLQRDAAAKMKKLAVSEADAKKLIWAAKIDARKIVRDYKNAHRLVAEKEQNLIGALRIPKVRELRDRLEEPFGHGSLFDKTQESLR